MAAKLDLRPARWTPGGIACGTYRLYAPCNIPCTARFVRTRAVGDETFAESFTGHWEGQAATFSPAGDPEALPAHIVPSALQVCDQMEHAAQPCRRCSLRSGCLLAGGFDGHEQC